MRKQFEDAGISLFAYTVNFRDDFTDDELDKAFEQAKALGVEIIAASIQLTLLEEKKYPIRAFVEYEHRSAGTPEPALV